MIHFPSLLLALQEAPATNAQPEGGGLLGMIVPMVLCFGVFWLLVLRPESKQRKLRQKMLDELGKGDRVMTSGGMYGKVVQMQDNVVTLEVADGVRLRFARSAIQSVETDGATSTERAVEAKT